MKSICIKTNNSKSIEYLLEKLNNSNLDNIRFSYRHFRNYENIIIHFLEKNEKSFFEYLSKQLLNLFFDLFEEQTINAIINSEYFYFDKFEKKQISEITYDDLNNIEEAIYPRKKSINLLQNIILEYICNNKNIYLKGFFTFRIKKYLNILCNQIDKSVNKFLIEKEYSEFISLLKMYISTEPCSCNLIHIVYNNNKSFLLDENKNIIEVNQNIFNAKFLSDITFSSSDYALNTLLTLLPKKIYIHLIDNKIDDFINTLKLIFEDRVTYCTDCDICAIYKKNPLLSGDEQI